MTILKGVTVEPILFLYCMLTTQTLTTIPQLILRKLCTQQGFGETCAFEHATDEENVQNEASSWMMIIYLCSTIPSIFTVVACGLLSQKYTRRRILIATPLLSAVQNGILIYTSLRLHSSNALMIVGAVAVSLYGDVQGVISLCYAHIADLTSSMGDSRTWRMALLESCLFISTALGGVTAGYLIQQAGYWSVFTLSLVCDGIMLVYIVFVLKDVPPDQRDSPSEMSLNPLTYARNIYKDLSEEGNRTILLVSLLVVAYACAVYGFWAEIYTIPLYLVNAPFHASSEEVGWLVSLPAFLRGLGALVLICLSYKYLYLSDFTLVSVGLLSAASVYIAFGLARSFAQMIGLSFFSLFIPVATAALRSMLTKLVSPQHNSALLGAIMSVDTLSNIVANFTSLEIYKVTLGFYSGSVYFAIAFLDLLALVFTNGAWRFINRTNYSNIE